MKPISMTRIVGGKKYTTQTATLVASDVYWDGNNMERSGRNTWLYRTPRGAFFTTTRSQWQGEDDRLDPVTVEEAKELFEGRLSEHEMKWSEAFGEQPQEPEPERGRPTLYEEKMKQTAIWLPDEMIAWLKSQPGTMSDVIRILLEEKTETETR